MSITQQAPPTEAMMVTMVIPGDIFTSRTGEFSCGGGVEGCAGGNSWARTNWKELGKNSSYSDSDCRIIFKPEAHGPQCSPEWTAIKA